MLFSDISNIRLANQHLTVKIETSPKQLIEYLGAIQAQDYPMAKWALGVRLNNVGNKDIELSLDNGEILRTHVLRPTWHLVSANDIHWMLELTAPHIHSSSRSRHKQLELDSKSLSKIYKLIEKNLRDNNHLTRDALYDIFHQEKIGTSDNRGAHIFMCAELEGLICSGKNSGKQRTFALLEERVSKPKKLNRDESLAKLANIYFTSRGPATINDFIWWSGLPRRDARKALEITSGDFSDETIEDETYRFSNNFDYSMIPTNSVLMLPSFDEYLIAYTNRKAAINKEIHTKKAVSNNGIFRPIIVVNGQVAGIWRRSFKKDMVLIETELFESLNKTQIKSVEKEAAKFGTFLDMKIELNI